MHKGCRGGGGGALQIRMCKASGAAAAWHSQGAHHERHWAAALRGAFFCSGRGCRLACTRGADASRLGVGASAHPQPQSTSPAAPAQPRPSPAQPISVTTLDKTMIDPTLKSLHSTTSKADLETHTYPADSARDAATKVFACIASFYLSLSAWCAGLHPSFAFCCSHGVAAGASRA